MFGILKMTEGYVNVRVVISPVVMNEVVWNGISCFVVHPWMASKFVKLNCRPYYQFQKRIRLVCFLVRLVRFCNVSTQVNEWKQWLTARPPYRWHRYSLCSINAHRKLFPHCDSLAFQPVSYTHLDVYKRQVYRFVISYDVKNVFLFIFIIFSLSINSYMYVSNMYIYVSNNKNITAQKTIK